MKAFDLAEAKAGKDANGYYMDMGLYDTPEEAEQTSDFVKVIEVKI